MRRIASALGLLCIASLATANTYTVTTTADSGAGSLRQAILDANANGGADTIAFNIAGTGPHTIAPAAGLPEITDEATIDGYTQAGASPNTNPVGQGLNTVLMIEIDCTVEGAFGCLAVSGDDVVIRGLVLNRSEAGHVRTLAAASNLAVEGCFIGTNPAGTQSVPDALAGTGVFLGGSQNDRIGGTTPAARNLISVARAGSRGIFASNGSGLVVQGNLIGTEKTGLTRMAEFAGSETGIYLSNAAGAVVGGTTAGAGNLVAGSNSTAILAQAPPAGNTFQGNYVNVRFDGQGVISGCNGMGISVSGASIVGGTAAGAGNVVGGCNSAGIEHVGPGGSILGNFVGTDPTASFDVGNVGRGISVTGNDVVVGGIGPGEANVVANNDTGVVVTTANGVTIRGNRIYANSNPTGILRLAIELFSGSGYGIDINDPDDADVGSNDLQNFPILTSAGPASPQGAGTRVQGVLNSTPSTVFDVDFYSNPACATRPQDYLQAEDYIGSIQVTTDGNGDAAFDEVLAANVEPGARITATATNPDGSTSELSQRIVFSLTPDSGPAAGGTPIQIEGMLFEDGATVSIGGIAAGDVVFVDGTTLTADSPAHAAGTLHAVTVTNPSGLAGTLPNGWVADFLDVPGGHLFHPAVTKLVKNGITAGVGGGNYGVSQSTLRQQMAVFLLKAKYGVCYAPPPCTGVFPDVTCPSTFAAWIEALAEEGITGGCGGGNYCPLNAVLRQQMAVFILKAKYGSNYVPPPCSGDFLDVACPGNPFADWIEQLAAEGITGGCGGGNFCPTNPVTRGQMAAFLSIAFGLQ